MQLRDYQQNGVDEVSRKIGAGHRRLCFQLATGGGKTITFSALIQRYIVANPNKRVLIAVHREELLKQARSTLYEFAGIVAHPIVAGVRYAPPSQVYVAMVETANNRLKNNPKWFGDVGMLIVDECHLGNHKKLYEYFPQDLIIGFTATPISSSKKDPLNNYFDDIISAIDIPDLIEQGALTPNRTYHIKNINRKALSIKGGEFDNKVMGTAFSSGKHVQNTVDAYEKFGKNTKAVVFNCNIEHSKLVTQAFVDRGYNARHFDGMTNKKIRAEALEWLHNTPDAILNNVGVLTTGFDEKSIETIIINRSTMSLPLWLQMTGRGSRLWPGKQYFTIIDLGSNAITHGDWCAPRDWVDLFHNPERPRTDKEGIVPQKECPGCEALVPAQATTCPFCGFDMTRTVQYDKGIPEFELVTKNIRTIDVHAIIEQSFARSDNAYYPLHVIKGSIVAEARRKSDKITTEQVYTLLAAFHEKVQEWCKEKKKNYDQWHKDTTAKWLFEEIKRQFGWEPATLTLDIAI